MTTTQTVLAGVMFCAWTLPAAAQSVDRVLPNAKPAPPAKTSWVVVDSTGREFAVGAGLPLELNEFALVLIPVDTWVIAAKVNRSYFLAGEYMNVYFEGPSCTGVFYIDGEQPPDWILPRAAITYPNSTVYVPEPDGTPTFVAYQSHAAPNGQCLNQSGSVTTVPARSLGSLTAMFPPPYTVRLK